MKSDAHLRSDTDAWQEEGRTVVQDWVSHLPFRMQAVLLSALRGCDGKPKEDPSKKLTRKLRGVMLHPAFSDVALGTFLNDEVRKEHVAHFLRNLDPYPMHWLMHFAHATEIVGYYHPDDEIRRWWQGIYGGICEAMHLVPEPKEMLDHRLSRGDVG